MSDNEPEPEPEPEAQPADAPVESPTPDIKFDPEWIDRADEPSDDDTR